MNTQSSLEKFSLPPSKSIKRHKKERFWQIFLPVGLISLIIIAGIVLIIIFGLKSTLSLSQLSDTALIWLIAPGLFFALITVVILGGLIYGIAKLTGILPRYTGRVQYYVGLVTVMVKKWSDKVVSPILAVESTTARFRKFWSVLARRSSR